MLKIGDESRDRAGRALTELAGLLTPKSAAECVFAGHAAAKALRKEIPELESFLAGLSKQPALSITNLPVNDEQVAVLTSLGLACLYGQPFQYSTQNGGELVGRLEPKPPYEFLSNTGEGRGEFEAHSDDEVLAPTYSVEWIQLLGKENEAGTLTHYIPLDTVLRRLSSPTLRTLQEPRFVFTAPKSFRLRMTVNSPPSPVLFRLPSSAMGVRLATHNTRPSDPEDEAAASALSEIKDVVSLPCLRYSVALGAGDCLIFDNNRGLHARDPITGRRLVFRTYVREDITPLQQKARQPGPVFDPWTLLR